MKTQSKLLTGAALSVSLLLSASADLTDGMTEGKPQLKSAGVLAFGPEGILFVADPQDASVVAIATGDTKPLAPAASLTIEDIGGKLAGLLGTSADSVSINDVAVNPESEAIYLSVTRGRGDDEKPALVRVTPDGKLGVVSLDNVKFSKTSLTNAPDNSKQRKESITDLAYLEGKVVIAGLSNEEFSSSLRQVEFPFAGDIGSSSVETYHAAHGRYETNSPIRTFIPMDIGGEVNLVASYICTPLVRFPMANLEKDKQVKGQTIAELGNRNKPLDMVEYQKDGKRFILMANSARGVMKISTDGIEKQEGLTEPVKGGGTKGLSFETLKDWTGITQLDRVNDDYAIVLQEDDSKKQTLREIALP